MRFIQIWILPDTPDLPPEVEQKVFTREDRAGRLLRVMGPEGGEVVRIHQDASVHVASLDAGDQVEHPIGPGRGAYVYLIDGAARFDGEAVTTGDAAKVTGQPSLSHRRRRPQRAHPGRRARSSSGRSGSGRASCLTAAGRSPSAGSWSPTPPTRPAWSTRPAGRAGRLRPDRHPGPPYQRRYLDTFSLLAALATATERIGLFPDVANLPLRHPAMLAKAAPRSTCSPGAGSSWARGGRVLGRGGGHGRPPPRPGEAVEALEEAIALVRLLWSDQRSVRFTGRHYQVAGVKPGPAPAHPIELWLGALGPRMLGVTGRVGDGWVPSSSYLPPERLPAPRPGSTTRPPPPAATRRPCAASTTSPAGSAPAAAGSWTARPASGSSSCLPLVTETGMDTFVLWRPRTPDRQLELFAAEVAPALREAVAAHRGAVEADYRGPVPTHPGESLAGRPAHPRALNQHLTFELTAVNQYFLNSRMCANWGYERLAKRHREIAMEEMRDTEELIDRILYLDGHPTCSAWARSGSARPRSSRSASRSSWSGRPCATWTATWPPASRSATRAPRSSWPR
jgi:hypothetical protein